MQPYTLHITRGVVTSSGDKAAGESLRITKDNEREGRLLLAIGHATKDEPVKADAMQTRAGAGRKGA